MTDHLKRKHDISFYALPRKGTKAYDERIKLLKKFSEANPQNDRIILERFKKAITIIKAQIENGAGLPLDEEIRFFLNQFNYRTFEHGLRSMPSSFNVLEGFFNYHPDLNFFELLEEENHLFSLFDYLDFITSPEFEEDSRLILDHLNEDLIYHYDVLNKLDQITFTTEDGNEYVVAGISLLRRGNEVLVFLLTGLITDTVEETKKIISKKYTPVSGREDIKIPEDRQQEAAALLSNSNYWKTLAYCRIDISNSTIDTRYIQKDLGTMYETITDDISCFINFAGDIKPEYKNIYEKGVKDIVAYSPLFELATKCLYLPFYFDHFENKISEEEHPTRFSISQKKSFFHKDNPIPIPKEYKIKSRTVYCLNRDLDPKSDIIYFGESEFKIERNGYWMRINYDAVGKDKNGNAIHGKTWVERTLTWYENDKQTLSANFNDSIKKVIIKNNQGHIYLMRNASHQIDIFKIGLTKFNSKERARKLSATTGSPDKFLVANEWFVNDCVLAEKMIHHKLDVYRINSSREFFKVDFEHAMKVITEIVNTVNSTNEPNKK
ncbi:T5orf172 domain protein [mine drainage metagenome]|uniref:T5orf172 domain protein n=1 Tax=mine drainage metagenome TaxID=410659 RepID=A0A1J5RAW2_9ZZZZ